MKFPNKPATRSTRWPRFFEKYPLLIPCEPALDAAFAVCEATVVRGGKFLVCGNGGSAADSEHIVGELMKGFLRPRPLGSAELARFDGLADARAREVAAQLQGALPAIALTSQIALSSAIANDTGAEMIFAQQVYGLGRPGDALLGISTSGNSRNVVNAFFVARALGLQTIALTGRSGGALRALADVAICAPADCVTEIQEFHLPIYHLLCLELEERFFGSPHSALAGAEPP